MCIQGAFLADPRAPHLLNQAATLLSKHGAQLAAGQCGGGHRSCQSAGKVQSMGLPAPPQCGSVAPESCRRLLRLCTRGCDDPRVRVAAGWRPAAWHQAGRQAGRQAGPPPAPPPPPPRRRCSGVRHCCTSQAPGSTLKVPAGRRRGGGRERQAWAALESTGMPAHQDTARYACHANVCALGCSCP